MPKILLALTSPSPGQWSGSAGCFRFAAVAQTTTGVSYAKCHSCILGMDVADRFILGQIRPWLSKIATSQAPRARTVVCPDASAGRKGECCKTGPERSIQVPKRRCSYS